MSRSVHVLFSYRGNKQANRQTNRQLDRQTYAGDYIIPRESFRGDNKHIYAVLVTVLLCVFSNDDEGKLPIKQITNWTVFGEIQTATTTFIACLRRLRFSPRPFENLHRIPTGPWRFITVSIPIPHPSPLESSSESPYPQQPCQSHTSPSVKGPLDGDTTAEFGQSEHHRLRI